MTENEYDLMIARVETSWRTLTDRVARTYKRILEERHPGTTWHRVPPPTTASDIYAVREMLRGIDRKHALCEQDIEHMQWVDRQVRRGKW